MFRLSCYCCLCSLTSSEELNQYKYNLSYYCFYFLLTIHYSPYTDSQNFSVPKPTIGTFLRILILMLIILILMGGKLFVDHI